MKKVRLKVLKNYKDLTLNRTVKKGEFITVTEDRAKKIMASKEKLAEIVQVETNPLPKAAQVTTKTFKATAVTKDLTMKDDKIVVGQIVSKKKKSKSNNAPDNGKKD